MEDYKGVMLKTARNWFVVAYLYVLLVAIGTHYPRWQEMGN